MTEDEVVDYVCNLSRDHEALRRVAMKAWDAFGGARSCIAKDILRVPLETVLAAAAVDNPADFGQHGVFNGLNPIACLAIPVIDDEIEWLYEFAMRDEFKPAVLEAYFPALRTLLSPLEAAPLDWKDALKMLASMAYGGLGASVRGDVLEFRYMMASFDDSFPFWSMVPCKHHEDHRDVIEDLMDTLAGLHPAAADTEADITPPIARVVLQEYLLLCVHVLLDQDTVEILRVAVRFMHVRLAIIATQQSMRAQQELLQIWTSPATTQKQNSTRPSRRKNQKKTPETTQGYLPARPSKASGYCTHFGKYGWCTATNRQGCTHAKHPLKIPIYVAAVN